MRTWAHLIETGRVKCITKMSVSIITMLGTKTSGDSGCSEAGRRPSGVDLPRINASAFKVGETSAPPDIKLPPDRDLSRLLGRLLSRVHTLRQDSTKPTHPGKRPHEVVNVDIWLLRVDVRSNLKEVLLDRGNISELEQSQCTSREISGGSHSFSKATVFLKQDKRALSMMGQVEKKKEKSSMKEL